MAGHVMALCVSMCGLATCMFGHVALCIHAVIVHMCVCTCPNPSVCTYMFVLVFFLVSFVEVECWWD